MPKNPEALRRMATYARLYADQCDPGRGRAWARVKPDLGLTPDEMRSLRADLRSKFDLGVDGHIEILLREFARLADEIADERDSGED